MNDNGPAWRTELKYICDERELWIMRKRLEHVMHLDPHAGPSGYLIRSVYLDDLENTCMRENEDGTSPRWKWRLRSYDLSPSRIVLERKLKAGDRTRKDSCILRADTFEAILRGECFLPESDNPTLLNRFVAERYTRWLRPVILVQYRRIPYVFGAGNVRVTFDLDICYSDAWDKLFDQYIPLRPVLPHSVRLLEVKFDEFLPDYLQRIVQIRDMQRTPFSKYWLCRHLDPLRR